MGWRRTVMPRAMRVHGHRRRAHNGAMGTGRATPVGERTFQQV